MSNWAEADLRKRALSAAYDGALQWRKFSILVDPKQISVVSKGEKHLLPCATFTWFGGSNLSHLFGGGPANDILRGPCQQLLTLLTLKSATGTEGPIFQRVLFSIWRIISHKIYFKFQSQYSCRHSCLDISNFLQDFVLTLPCKVKLWLLWSVMFSCIYFQNKHCAFHN